MEVRPAFIGLEVCGALSLITAPLSDIFRDKLEKRIDERILPTLIEAVCFGEVSVGIFFLLHITGTLFGQQIVPFLKDETVGITPYIYITFLMVLIVIEFVFLVWLGKRVGEDVEDYMLFREKHKKW